MQASEAKILVVDDCRMNSLLLRHILSQQGTQSDAASTGPEALTKAIEGSYHLIFMDIVLPGMDGLEVARHLIQHDFEVDPKIVFMTGVGENSDTSWVEASGACDILLKPIAPSSVTRLLKIALPELELA